MKTFRPRSSVILALVLLPFAGSAMAQSGLTYSIVVDSSGNIVGQLSGASQDGTLSLDASLPGTVLPPTPTPTPAPGAPTGWTKTGWGNGALDIAVGANGTPWFTAASGTIYTVNSGAARDIAGGVAVRITVDKSGTPWCVTVGKAIFRLVNGVWQQLPGGAVDIGAGGDGSVYIINPDLSISKWNGSGWTPFQPGSGGTRIAVDQSGNPWVVNANNVIFRWTGTQWLQLPGAAKDISISSDGAAYVLGMASSTGGYAVYHWDPAASNWSADNVYGTVVAGAPGGHVYVGRAASSLLPTITR